MNLNFKTILVVFSFTITFLASCCTSKKSSSSYSNSSDTIISTTSMSLDSTSIFDNNSSEIVDDIEYEFDSQTILHINDYTAWDISLDSFSEEKEFTQCFAEKPIRVIERQRFIIDWFDCSGVCVGIMGSFDNSIYDCWLGWHEHSCNSVIDIPDSVCYIKIYALKEHIEVSNCIEADIKLINVTTDEQVSIKTERIQKWHKEDCYAQGMAISDSGLIFQAFSNGTVEIRDSNGLFLDLLSLPIPSGEFAKMHCNNISFGPKANDDDFGLLWISSNGIGTKILACKIYKDDFNHFTAKTVYEVSAPSLDKKVYKDVTQYFDFSNNIMVQAAYFKKEGGGHGDVQLFKYCVDCWNENPQFELIDNFKTTKMWAMQSGIIKDSKLFILCGSSNFAARINVLNLEERTLEYIIDFRKPVYTLDDLEEVQGIANYNGDIYISTSLWNSYPRDSFCSIYRFSINQNR